MSNTAKTPKYTTPPNKIKEKVGGGGIDPERLKQAQEHINNNNFDFRPIANSFIEKIKDFIERSEASNEQLNHKDLVSPIMQLKANGGMFKYDLVTQIADICLNFVEEIEILNADARVIITAHTNAISVILQNKMTGNGGPEGKALSKELEKACNLYFKKHPPKTSK